MQTALQHHGIYAYRVETLQRFVAAERSPLEIAEELEQLRALALGMTIRVGIPDRPPGRGVDVEEDLVRVERELAKEAET
jgi:3-deoxy-manno-octulosonate cytidylyltransferase (CMP-KDO synthetase)